MYVFLKAGFSDKLWANLNRLSHMCSIRCGLVKSLDFKESGNFHLVLALIKQL